MSYPQLYRKRLIPDECVLLKDDKILLFNPEMIVTSWNTLHPKKDLHHGASCFYLNKGWKISYFYKEDNSLLFTYCDIITCLRDETANTLTVVDLLADVIVYPDGFVRVVDLDELAEAVSTGLLDSNSLNACLISLNSLLTEIYNGNLSSLTAPMDALI